MLPREELLAHLSDLSLEELEALMDWLRQQIKTRKQEVLMLPVPLKKGREVIETYSTDKTTYRLEKVKCGKKKCKCNKGKLHGPYWYAYTWDKKKLKSTYIGKALPDQELQSLTQAHEQQSPA
jgi:hypothetical protein